jgi:hypothetical protein
MSDYWSYGSLHLRRVVPPQRPAFRAPRGVSAAVAAAEGLRASARRKHPAAADGAAGGARDAAARRPAP